MATCFAPALAFAVACTRTPALESLPAGQVSARPAAPPPSALPISSVGSASDAAPPPALAEDYAIDAAVEALEPLGQRAGTAWPVDVDPRFSLLLRVRSVEPAMSDDPPGSAIVAGSTVMFAIHSPARLFLGGASGVAGRRVRLRVTRSRLASGVRYSALRVEPR